MMDWQRRVVEEEAELYGRIGKLQEFIEGESFAGVDFLEQERLKHQLDVMRVYGSVLRARIDAFK